MSNLVEIRQRLEHLSELSSKMREQFARLSGPEGQELRKKAKEEGTRIGIGAGISAFGAAVVAVAAVYINAVIILLINIALDRLWLSSLIVVGGFLLIGGAIAAIGAVIVSKSGKEFSKIGKDISQQLKATSEEMKQTVEELQSIAKKEAEVRQRQAKDLAETAKTIAPYVVGAYIGYRVAKRLWRSRSARRSLLKEEWEEG